MGAWEGGLGGNRHSRLMNQIYPRPWKRQTCTPKSPNRASSPNKACSRRAAVQGAFLVPRRARRGWRKSEGPRGRGEGRAARPGGGVRILRVGLPGGEAPVGGAGCAGPAGPGFEARAGRRVQAAAVVGAAGGVPGPRRPRCPHGTSARRGQAARRFRPEGRAAAGPSQPLRGRLPAPRVRPRPLRPRTARGALGAAATHAPPATSAAGPAFALPPARG